MPSTSFQGLKTILGSARKSKPIEVKQDTDVHGDFEELLRDQEIPSSVREKLRNVDDTVKQAFVSSLSSASEPRPSSPRKHERSKSRNLLSPKKKTRVLEDPLAIEDAEQYIAYLNSHTPQQCKGEIVHKLRILLRIQRITWLRSFFANDGAETLYRSVRETIQIEWRDEHDDHILAELLGCIQSIITTTLGLQTLTSTFLASLVQLLFSSKQPSDFGCRQQIINLLEAYLKAVPALRETRARQILIILADPPKPLAERLPEMLEKAHTSRPYKMWMTELSKPVRDCFWIFLHSDNLINVIEPSACDAMVRRQPVVPEGYVGGIEWTAIEYITAHLSLVNSLLESMPNHDRCELRTNLKASRFEKILGQQLRRASTKFYVRDEASPYFFVAHLYADLFT